MEDPTISIYTLPDPIRNVDSDAYERRYMTLVIDTPYDLKLMTSKGHDVVHSHAHGHLLSILHRNRALSLNDYMLTMTNQKDQIKGCHHNDITIDISHQVLMIYKSCFIVDVLLPFYEGRLTSSVDFTCGSIYSQILWMDFLLVENQLPFFVLQKVFDMAVVDKSRYPSLVDIALYFFDHFMERDLQKPDMVSKSVHHLLHLVHHHLLPLHPPQHLNQKSHPLTNLIFNKLRSVIPLRHSPPTLLPKHNQAKQLFVIKPLPSAKRLKDTGIKFKKREGTGFQNVCFDSRNGVLEIRSLSIHSNTKILLRNLIAWEQCQSAAWPYFTAYAIFMDYIVKTEEDTEILVQSGIIEHSFCSNKDVTPVFNGLSANLVYTGLEDNFLPHICNELNKYCHNPYHIWWANLMTFYFSNPWTIILATTIIILILFKLFLSWSTIVCCVKNQMKCRFVVAFLCNY